MRRMHILSFSHISTQILLTVLVILTSFQYVASLCRHSFMTVSDELEGVKYIHRENDCTGLIIGSDLEDDRSLESVDLWKFFSSISKSRHLTTLIVLYKIKLIVPHFNEVKCMYHHSKLRYINFYGNEIENIDKFTKFPLLELDELKLVNNKIRTIKSDTFAMHKIKTFDVSNNLLEVVERGAFPQTNVTKIIRAKKNKLEHIEAGGLPASLSILNLDYNELNVIHPVILHYMKDLEELTLSHNQIDHVPNLQGLPKLSLLDLSFNVIASISYQQFKITNLLKLSHNRISDPNILQHFTIHKGSGLTIYMDFNNLKHLNCTSVSHLYKRLVLCGNPWDCAKWETMKRQLEMQEADCEKAYFYNGVVPFCVNYTWGRSFTALEQTQEEDLAKFKSRVGSVKCNSKVLYIEEQCYYDYNNDNYI